MSEKNDMSEKNVVVGILATTYDNEKKEGFWQPSVQLASQPDFPISRFHLLYSGSGNRRLAEEVKQKIENQSPQTEVTLHTYKAENPWNFKDVSSALYTFIKEFTYDPETENCYVHVTTGTEVAKMCWCLFIHGGYLQAKMVQSIQPGRGVKEQYAIFEPDLKHCPDILEAFRQKYAWASEFFEETLTTTEDDKKREAFTVADTTRDPILLTGETGTGKTYFAREIQKHLAKKCPARKLATVEAENILDEIADELVPFVNCNCATLSPALANSRLFGHEKGAFTGAIKQHIGLLERANEGILFLDEIGELPVETQGKLLKAIDEKRFEREGADAGKGNGIIKSDFFLICATNKDLRKAVKNGKFRDDLLARIDTWSIELDSFQKLAKAGQRLLRQRLTNRLAVWNKKHSKTVDFADKAKEVFLKFAEDPNTPWKANYRDLNKIITRMATYAAMDGNNSRITEEIVRKQISRLQEEWKQTDVDESNDASKAHPDESVQSHPLYEELKRTLRKRGKSIDDYEEWEVQHLLYLLPICRKSKDGKDVASRVFARKLFKKPDANASSLMIRHLKKYKLKFDDLR